MIKEHKKAAKSYRCSTRSISGPLSDIGHPEQFIQLKAINAVEAMRLAHLVTGKAIIEAQRLEG